MTHVRLSLALICVAATVNAQQPQRVVRETHAQWQTARVLPLNATQRWCRNADAPGCDMADISDAVALGDGGILAINLSGPIHRFDSTGTFREALSRRGRGPGEYRFVVAPELLSNGQLAWYDQAQRRVTTIALDGTPGPAPQLLPPVTVSAVGLSGGNLVVLDVPSAATLGDTVSATYHTVSVSGEPRVIARVRTPSVFAPGVPMRAWPAPFSPLVVSSIGWAGDIAHSNGARYEVDIFPSTGSAWRLSVGIPSRPVSNEERRSMIAQLLADAKVSRVEDLPPQTRDQLAKAGSTVPPLQDIRVLRDGTIWIKPTPFTSDKVARWDVYSRGGARVGQARLPLSARIADGTRDWVLAIERGADDVPVVVRYAVQE